MPGGLRHKLVAAAAGSLGMRILQAGLALLISMLLARMLGAGNMGTYAAVIAAVQLSMIPVQSGVTSLLARQFARLHYLADWAAMRGLLGWATASSAVYCSLVAAGFSIAGPIGAGPVDAPEVVFGIVLGVFAIGAGRIIGGVLRGLRHVVVAQSFDVTRNLAIAMFLVAVMVAGTPIAVRGALAIFLAATCIAAAWLAWQARTRLPGSIARAEAVYRPAIWLRAAAAYTAINGLMRVTDQAGVIFVRTLASSTEAGHYQVAHQAASLLLFGLTAVTMSAMPYFTQLHEARDRRRLQMLVRKCAQASFAFAATFSLAMILWGDRVLEILFGAQFASAQPALIALCLAYLAQASTGPSGPLLTATGHEKSMLTIAAGTAVTALGLLAALVPDFGSTGAGMAVAISMSLMNIALWCQCRRKIGIDTFFLTA